jgi:hypothetical protein
MRSSIMLGLTLVIALAAASIVTAQDDPKVLQAVPPIYPLVALSARASGVVVIEAQIAPNGPVASARTIEGALLLRPISEVTARRWLFASASAPGLRTVRLKFLFMIVSDETSSSERVPIFKPPYEVEIRDAVPKFVHTPNIDPGPKRKRKHNST